jgi:LytS/YehU family sensor histidine kinase
LKLKSDYNSLQDQLNPHFLFNNLSVLKSMITYEPDAAIVFTQNFTDVYRYVLQSREHTTVKLTDEVEFIKAYIGVHQERLGKALVNSMTINESAKYKNIPPLALQLLVENAIKHNVAIESEPLMLDIYTTEDSIVVTNNLNFKDSRHSTNRGLKNLIQRYEMLTDKKISIQSDNGFFEVKIPLL